MSVTYGYTVSWRKRGGARCSVTVSGASTINEAMVESFESAKRLGYKRPSFWQIVRWLSEPDYEAAAARPKP